MEFKGSTPWAEVKAEIEKRFNEWKSKNDKS